MMELHENSNYPAFDWSNEIAVAFEHLWTLIFKLEDKQSSEMPDIKQLRWVV